MLRDPSFRRGLRDSALIFAAVGSFGLFYGVLAVEAGLSGLLTIVSSLIVVSGAAQFATIGLLATGATPVLVAVTGLGLRHLPMSATLSRLIGPRPLLTRLRMAFILVDETFGLTVRAAAAGVSDLVAYKSAADLMLYSSWMIGTTLGVVLGTTIDPVAVGIDILFGLLFLGLAAPFVRTRRDWVVAGAAVAATLIAVETIPPAWRLATGAAAASLVGMFLDE